jgi:hypothetical protein
VLLTKTEGRDHLRLSANAYIPRCAALTIPETIDAAQSQQSLCHPVNFMMLGDWEIEIKVNSGIVRW